MSIETDNYLSIEDLVELLNEAFDRGHKRGVELGKEQREAEIMRLTMENGNLKFENIELKKRVEEIRSL